MILLECLFVLISVLCCNSAPASDTKIPAGKQCTKPEIQNGEVMSGWNYGSYFRYPRFPLNEGYFFYYSCVKGYSPPNRDRYDSSYCTREGWQPQPTCSKKPCGKPKDIENGEVTNVKPEYKSSERVTFQCSEGYTLSRTFATCLIGTWFGIPECIDSRCENPPTIANGKPKEPGETTGKKYLPESRVEYQCNRGYAMKDVNHVICKNSQWINTPECRKTGESCGIPPAVNYGDIEGRRRDTYPSGSSVKYTCMQWHTIDGKAQISCKDGEWEKPPSCREPCTIRELDMKMNNVEFVHRNFEKIYSVHGDSMTFRCISGYEMPTGKLLRVQCLDGKINYPKCFKKGFCELDQSTTKINNLYYNESDIVENGNIITFECTEGMIPVGSLDATCREKQITYPKCISSHSTCGNPPIIANGKPKNPGDRDTTGKKYLPESKVEYQCNPEYSMKDVNHVICKNSQWINEPKCRKTGESCGIPPVVNYGEIDGRRQLTYTSGSSVQYTCIQWHILDGKAHISCKDGEWEMPPLCREPCTVRESDMKINNIEFVYRRTEKIYSQHGDSFTFWCVSGYEIPVGKPLRIQCLDGKVNYPKCFKKGFCELDQSTIKRNNLYYEESDIVENNHTITFECTEGMIPEGSLDATCREKQITYPKCITS